MLIQGSICLGSGKTFQAADALIEKAKKSRSQKSDQAHAGKSLISQCHAFMQGYVPQ
jgi:hypothetical protein